MLAASKKADGKALVSISEVAAGRCNCLLFLFVMVGRMCAAAIPRVPPSKSLDELISLSSSLAASLPKLDLLPLKADIGEIMMAGEDSSGDD